MSFYILSENKAIEKKLKQTQFKASYHIPCTTIHDYSRAHMQAENICYTVDMAN